MADNLNITPEMIDNLLTMFKNNSNNSENSQPPPQENEPNTFGNIDFETIMKIKTIMESLNTKNDKDTNLLYSLKPYLRKSKQDKIDQYINILKFSQVSKLFRSGNGDEKNDAI